MLFGQMPLCTCQKFRIALVLEKVSLRASPKFLPKLKLFQKF